MDKIIIEALAIDTVIGVYEFERHYPQRLFLDATLDWDIQPAAATDELTYALDYAAVCARLRKVAREESVQLVETLVEKFAQILYQEFSVTRMSLHLRKPSALADTGAVGVCIERCFD